MAQDALDPPSEPTKDAKGRFLPGHKFARGRPKGSENKFGPSFRERLLAGISRSGVKKAQKAGKNAKVDGIEYYLEHLADTNGAATASIIGKLIPPEPDPAPGGFIHTVNVISVPHDHSFCPDGHLRPNFEAGPLWDAHYQKLKTEETPLLQLEHATVIEQEMIQVEPEPRLAPTPPAPEPELAPVLESIPKYVPLPPRRRESY